MQKPHVILIAYYFPPSEAIGAARPFRFYKYLTQAGYTCDVITASRPADSAPGVSFVPDDLGDIWESREKQRLSLRAHIERFLRWSVFYAGTGVLWSFDAARCCRRIIARNRHRKVVVFSTFPPIGVLMAGLLVALWERVAWISDFRDPFVVDSSRSFRGWLNRFLFARMEALAFRRARGVIANTGIAGEMWRARYPAEAGKVQVICNGFDPEDRPRARQVPGLPRKVILHAGSLYAGRNPNLIVESLARLRRQNLPPACSVEVWLLGSIGFAAGLKQSLYDEAVRDGWLEFRPAVPKAEARRMAEETAGLLLLQPQSSIQVPGKLFEYLCIGRPILALVQPCSAVEQILQRAGVPNVCLYPDDPPETANRKLLEFLAIPSDPVQANAWFEATFNARSQTVQLASMIDRVV